MKNDNLQTTIDNVKMRVELHRIAIKNSSAAPRVIIRGAAAELIQ